MKQICEEDTLNEMYKFLGLQIIMYILNAGCRLLYEMM